MIDHATIFQAIKDRAGELGWVVPEMHAAPIRHRMTITTAPEDSVGLDYSDNLSDCQKEALVREVLFVVRAVNTGRTGYVSINGIGGKKDD